MTQPIVELGRSDLWNLVFDQTLVVTRAPNSFLAPAPPYLLPSALTHHILLIHCRSNEERAARWVRGCLVSQMVPVGTATFGQNLAIANTKSVMQFVPTLVMFPKYSFEYFLRINLYRWFSELSIQVWEYTGIDSDTSTETLLSIENDVRQIYLNLVNSGSP